MLLAVLVTSVAGGAEATAETLVRYRSKDTVYLSSGRAAGLGEGDRLEVLRGGARIGVVEVVFVAEHSASCRILEERQPIQPEDRARRIESAVSQDDGAVAAEQSVADVAPAAAATSAASTPPVDLPPRKTKRPRTRASGVLELGWDSYQDDSEAGLDFERFAARLSLRIRDIGGRPFQLRVRLRAEENQRERSFGNGAPESESRNRFYEAAVLYNPSRGRFAFQAGRIAVSPFIAVGFLDGVVAQVRLIPTVDVGALFGSRPVIQDGFESVGQKYGAYTRFSGFRQRGRPALEVFVAGIREDGEEEVSREYVSLETRYTPGGRWSLYQRAELDLNNGWREEASGSKTQLSNLALTLDTRLSRFSRVSLSYDRWERYRTEETRSITDELFDDLLRQGLRARFSMNRPGGLGFSLYAGYRDREGDEENTTSFGGAIRHSNIANLGLSLGGDLLGYSNPMTEGLVARLRTAKRFRGGHEIALLIGGRLYQNRLFEDLDDRSDQWIRLSGWVELPFNLFARAEFEIDDGDDIQGQRIFIGAGYRL